MPTLVLVNILGGVVMLLWGLQMVRNGMMRAFGAKLRDILSFSTSNRIKSFFSGVIFTLVLQSSTATTLIISSFLANGLITLPMAIAVILGADTGTTIVAQILTFDLSWLASVLLLFGYVIYQFREKISRFKHLGHVFIGLGLMLMALALIRQASDPLKQSEILPLILQTLSNDFLLTIIIASCLTWLFHSSLAMVLLIATLPLPLELALVMILGANIGGVLPALTATLKDKENSFRVPLANLCVRLIGTVIALICMPWVVDYASNVDVAFPQIVVSFHMAFNILLGLAFLPFCRQLAGFTEKFGKEKRAEDLKPKPGMPLYLDMNDLDMPTIALSNASREVMRMADKVEEMLFQIYQMFRTNNEAILARVKEMDDEVDNLYVGVKNYLAKLSSHGLDEADADRHMLLISYATSLEHAGDIIDRSLINMASKKIEKKKVFSPEGFKDIRNFFEQTIDSLKLSRNVFMTEDSELARRLFIVKGDFKRDERESSERHMQRLAEGVPETLATSSMHMDIIRDLVRIQSLLSSVSYPILERSGQLRKTRLVAE